MIIFIMFFTTCF